LPFSLPKSELRSSNPLRKDGLSRHGLEMCTVVYGLGKLRRITVAALGSTPTDSIWMQAYCADLPPPYRMCLKP